LSKRIVNSTLYFLLNEERGYRKKENRKTDCASGMKPDLKCSGEMGVFYIRRSSQ
jgi:hypothetical protein